MMHQHDYDVINYIDDILGTDLPSHVDASFVALSTLLPHLGFAISHNKLVKPSTCVNCLGILVNTDNFTLSIPHDKLQEILEKCKTWCSRTHCNKCQLQSLLGSLLYVSFMYCTPLATHLAAIKANLSLYGLPTHIFQDSRIKYFQKAMTLCRPFKPSLKSIIDIDTLQLLVRFHIYGTSFKAVYTLAFFFVLKLSNLVPHSVKNFSPLYHLAKADIILASPGLHIIVKWTKWTKTIQDRKSIKILKLPSLGVNPICPVTAVKNLLKITPGSNNSPLFQYKTATKWLPLTDTQVRHHFKHYFSSLTCSIPISLSKHSVVQVPHSPLIRMFLARYPESWHLDVRMRLEIYYP